MYGQQAQRHSYYFVVTNSDNNIGNIKCNNKDINNDSNMNDIVKNDNNEMQLHTDLRDNHHKVIIEETSGNIQNFTQLEMLAVIVMQTLIKRIIVIKYVQIFIILKIV